MVHATKPLFLTFTIIIFIFSSRKVISTQKMTAFHENVPMTQMEAWDIWVLEALTSHSWDIREGGVGTDLLSPKHI